MERLLRKFETARGLLPRPILRKAARPTRVGVIHYGSTAAAMDEALDLLAANGVDADALRIRAFPLSHEIADFVQNHDQVFVVEQNRDAQMRTLMTTDLGLDPARLTSILHYGGMSITARYIVREISGRLPKPVAKKTVEAVS
jgi:2-oxoglutarate ferredoxin oxidoreductase subunit alpha